MAAKSGGSENMTRLGMAVIGQYTQILRDILSMHISQAQLYNDVKTKNIRLRPDQEILVAKAKMAGYADFNITLLYYLIRNLRLKIPKPTRGWGKSPRPGDITLGDDIERICFLSNKIYGHIFSTFISDADFSTYWSEITNVCRRMEKVLGGNYVKNITEIANCTIDEHTEQKYQKIESERERKEELKENIRAVHQKIKDLKERMEDLKLREETHRTSRLATLFPKLFDGVKQNVLEEKALDSLDVIIEEIDENTSEEYILGILDDISGLDDSSYISYNVIGLINKLKVKLDWYISVSKITGKEIMTKFKKLTKRLTARHNSKSKLEAASARLQSEIDSVIQKRFLRLFKEVKQEMEKVPEVIISERKSGSELLTRKRNLVLLWSLLAGDQYCINLNDNMWEKSYQMAADILEVDPIPSVHELLQDKDLTIFISTDDNQLRFKTQEIRELVLLKLSEDGKFKQFFLTNAGTENITQYCRTSGYLKEEGEVCFCLAETQTDELIERLGLEILTHPTMEDTNIHSVVSNKFSLPMEVMKWKKEGIERFRHHLQYGQKRVFCARGMLVGCRGAGKTTLLKRLKDMHISEVIKTESTRGIDVHMDVLEIHGNTLKVREGTHRSCYLGIDPCLFLSSSPTDELDVPAKGNTTSHDEHQNKRESSQKVSTESAPIIQLYNTTKEDVVIYARNEDIQKESLQNTENSYQSIPRFLPDIVEKNNVPTVSFMDFAGQIEYYACHQVYMSPRSFYLLVIDMSKSLDEKMESEMSGYFAGWTHFEYISFWLNLIHYLICKDKITKRKEECHKRCPVVLVATHAESKSEEEKDDFFEELQRRLPDNGIKDHIYKEHAIGFVKDADGIEDLTELKKDICSLVKGLGHWGEFLPNYWVYFEKKFRQMKDDANIKIIHQDDLNDIRDRLSTEMKFCVFGTDDLALMLKFFHEIGIILHFDQDNLKNIIILDIQWFVDGFKHIITAHTHSRKDLRECIREWDFFDKTGELHCHLIEIVWKKSPLHLKYKDQLLQYMERLGMLAAVSEDNETWWYVPCMNKTPFSRKIFQQFQKCSSTLCFRFESLPMFIYFRFVAVCVSRWRILTERNKRYNSVKRHLYQTMAVFLYKNHNILIGIERETIQIQIITIETDIDKTITREVKSLCLDILEKLSTTFSTYVTFSIGYKCKISIFGDEDETSILPDKYLSEETTFQCTDCPFEKKHQVNAKEILSFWEKDEAERNEMDQNRLESGITEIRKSDSQTTDDFMSDMRSLAPKNIPCKTDDEEDNFQRFSKLLEVGTDALRMLFDKLIPPSELMSFLADEEVGIRNEKHIFRDVDLTLLYPSDRQSVTSLSFDISMMYKLMRNHSKIGLPSKGEKYWGKQPEPDNTNNADDLERLRIYRNYIQHSTSKRIESSAFQIKWLDLSHAIRRLSSGTLNQRISDLLQD